MNEGARKTIRLDMTGEEFKRLIEQYNPDNEVNTLPEVLRMLQGIGDNESLAEYIERKINEGVTVIPANSVGSEQIKDGSIEMNDLNDELKEKITDTYVEESETLYLGERPQEEETNKEER